MHINKNIWSSQSFFKTMKQIREFKNKNYIDYLPQDQRHSNFRSLGLQSKKQ